MGSMVIYDGDCGFCTVSARWLQQRLRIPISVIPWQEIHDLGELELTQADVTSAAYYVDPYGRVLRGHLAIARALLQCRGAWPAVGVLLSVPPGRAIAAAAYRLVARYRGQLPGATAACGVPRRRSFSPAASPSS
jgi:predicted DCC family thiol-disulfide oxidoreductase YuxK